jgi:hypothetical protein
MNSTRIQVAFQRKKRVALFYFTCVSVCILLLCACGQKALQDSRFHISGEAVAFEMRDTANRSWGKESVKKQEQPMVKAATSKKAVIDRDAGLGKNGGNNNLFNRGF